MSGNVSIHVIDYTNTLTNGKVKWIPLNGDSFGSLHVNVKSDFRGNYPETWYLNGGTTANATNTDNLVIYTSPDISQYNATEFAATSGAVTIQGTLDGTTYSADLAFVDLESTTPATRVKTTTGTTHYRLEGKWKNIKVLQDGVGAAANVRIVHVVI